jgi:hypothetical protein
MYNNVVFDKFRPVSPVNWNSSRRDDILAGTELPLILRASEHNGIPLLDTTKIHVEKIVAELIS